MRITLGFRAAPAALSWAAVTGTAEEPQFVDAGTIAAPATIREDEAAVLAWIHNRVLLLLNEHHPEAVGVRYAESFGAKGARDPDRKRARIEGIVMLAAKSRGIEVATGPLKMIGARLGSKKPKDYLEDQELRGIDLSGRSKEQQEAILAGVSMLPEE